MIIQALGQDRSTGISYSGTPDRSAQGLLGIDLHLPLTNEAGETNPLCVTQIRPQFSRLPILTCAIIALTSFCELSLGQVANQEILRKIPQGNYKANVSPALVRTNVLLQNLPDQQLPQTEVPPTVVVDRTETAQVVNLQASNRVAELQVNPQPPEPNGALRSQVIRVRKDNQQGGETVIARAGLNDELWIDVRGFPEWLALINSNRVQANLPSYEVRDLIPFFNSNPLPGVHPNYAKTAGEVTNLRFKLVRNKDSKEAWSRLWKHPRFEKAAGVSVGFANGEEIPTLVVEDASEARHRFSLVLLRQPRFWLGMTVLVGALLLFLRFARDTDIIRDTTAPERPDGKWPYSLAKAQMAFWFFLVIASFFFLWVLTGAMDTLNNSVLILIGISASTAIGAAMIDAGKTAPRNTLGNVPPVDTRKPRSQVVQDLTDLMTQKQQELDREKQVRAKIQKDDMLSLNDNEKRIESLQKEITNLEVQKGYFSYPAWRGVLNDLLGDHNVIGFHRFQIFVWTLLLGLIFVTQVYNEFAMPDFDATLLGLLGISAGTYVGFKLPESRRETVK